MVAKRDSALWVYVYVWFGFFLPGGVFWQNAGAAPRGPSSSNKGIRACQYRPWNVLFDFIQEAKQNKTGRGRNGEIVFHLSVHNVLPLSDRQFWLLYSFRWLILNRKTNMTKIPPLCTVPKHTNRVQPGSTCTGKGHLWPFDNDTPHMCAFNKNTLSRLKKVKLS